MNIQSCSIVVPCKGSCMNHCKSCPSRMHDNDYDILMDQMQPDFDLYLNDYIKRLEYARKNGCNVAMLTGTSEPQQNRNFLLWFGMMQRMMKDPFQCIEMQTTGATIDLNYLQFLRRHVGVTMMALSVFSLDSKENEAIICPPKGVYINLPELAKNIRDTGMSIRMCLNLTKHFDQFAKDPCEFFEFIKHIYFADQLTLRELYYRKNSGDPVDVWVRKNAADNRTINEFEQYIKKNGTRLGVLPYGAVKYSVNGMSVVLDSDSMGKENPDPDTFKYVILRPDCKLYSSWDDKASLIF